jgi:hypothetical protein
MQEIRLIPLFPTHRLFNADDPLPDWCESYGGSLIAFLGALINDAGRLAGLRLWVAQIDLGGGRGNRGAEVVFQYSDAPDMAMIAFFGFESLGGGRRPDDAPAGRLDRYASVPGEIIPILHHMLDGDEGHERSSMTEAFQH